MTTKKEPPVSAAPKASPPIGQKAKSGAKPGAQPGAEAQTVKSAKALADKMAKTVAKTKAAATALGAEAKAGAGDLRKRMSAAATRAQARLSRAQKHARFARGPKRDDEEPELNRAPGTSANRKNKNPITGPRHHPSSFGRIGETIMAAISLGAVGLMAALYAAFIVIAPEGPEGEDLWAVNRLPSIVILDRHGEEIAARGARYGEAVSVDELGPPVL